MTCAITELLKKIEDNIGHFDYVGYASDNYIAVGLSGNHIILERHIHTTSVTVDIVKDVTDIHRYTISLPLFKSLSIGRRMRRVARKIIESKCEEDKLLSLVDSIPDKI